jgi:hypothetical protein
LEVKTMATINVNRSVYIESPNDAEERTVTLMAYADSDRTVLIRNVMDNGPSGKSHVLQRSEDSGKTWSEGEKWQTERPIDENLCMERYLGGFVLDTNHSVLIRFIVEIKRDKRISMIAKDSPYKRYRYLYYQTSHDCGMNWGDRILVVMDGYDEEHWAPEVWQGRSSLAPSGSPPLVLSDDRICLPCYLFREDKDDDLGPDGPGMLQSCCLLGTWSKDLRLIKWEAGEYAAVTRTQAIGGIYEPAVVELRDGRLLMILRADLGYHDAAKRYAAGPCYKWYAISSDCGVSWSKPEILKYDDGSPAYSPASYSLVVRSAENGKAYLIANLNNYAYEFWSSGPCWPRDILQIAEIDEKRLRLKRRSVTVIEEREPDQPRYIGFSNFVYYQDRLTQNLVLFMTPMVPGYPAFYDSVKACRKPGSGVPGHSYRYDISFCRA